MKVKAAEAIKEDPIDHLLKKGYSVDELKKMCHGENLPTNIMQITPHSDNNYNGKFQPHIMHEDFFESGMYLKIDGTVHYFDGHVYLNGENNFHSIYRAYAPSLRNSQRNEVYRLAQIDSRIPEGTIAPARYIPFKTKIYDIQEKAFRLYKRNNDRSNDIVFTYRFACDYNPDAPEAPTVTKFLQDITGGDADLYELLLEAIGYTLYRKNIFRCMILLHDSRGSSGKSTLLNLIRQFVGSENVSYLSLQELSERFKLAEINAKAVNIGDDIPGTHIKDSSIVKKLVTGERITAERKGEQPFSFTPSAKLFFACNTLPTASDKSAALLSRMQIIPMPRRFTTSCDINLKDKIWSQDELNYLCKLAVEALHRLLERGSFVQPDAVKAALVNYETYNNSVFEFLEEYGDIEGHSIQTVYDAYKDFCDKSGHRYALTRNKFTQDVIDQRPELKSQPARVNGILTRTFKRAY